MLTNKIFLLFLRIPLYVSQYMWKKKKKKSIKLTKTKFHMSRKKNKDNKKTRTKNKQITWFSYVSNVK